MDIAATQVAHVMGPVYLVVGLSVLLYVKPWQQLLEKWEHDHLSLFPLMLMYVVLGILMVNIYNVWEWKVEVLVTLIGWILFVKGALYFLLPGALIKKTLALKSNTGLLYLGGLVALVLGAVLTYYSYYV